MSTKYTGHCADRRAARFSLTSTTRAAAVSALVFATVVVGLVRPAPAHTAPIPAVSAPAVSIPNLTSANGSKINRIEVTDDRSVLMFVQSGSMNREIPLDVLLPRDPTRPAPTLYLLNGAGGGEDGATWRDRTDAVEFFADKQVNVVTPLKGASSYYTDWRYPDPNLGVNKWTTFLTRELPPLIDAALGTTGVNAIAGLSSSATSVLALPIHAPGLYAAAAWFSGCAQTSDPLGQAFVRTTVESWGGNGNTYNMWGPPDDPLWAANDPYVHAAELRGVDLYVAVGNGLPGPHDTLHGPDIGGRPLVLANQIAVGGAIEMAVDYCTHNLSGRLAELGIPATFDFRPNGTHSWGYWQDDLKKAWPLLARSLCA